MAVQREGCGLVVAEMIAWREVWIGQNLDSSFSGSKEDSLSVPREAHLVGLDGLLM